MALVEAQPIRQMQLTVHRSDLEMSVTNLEKSLLEDDAQDLIPQKFCRTPLGQSRPQPVAAIPREQLPFLRNSWKLEQVERSIHGVDGEEPRWCARVFHAV